MLSAEVFAGFLIQLGIYAILGSVIINIIIAITGVLPSIFVTGANVILFGPFYGLLVSWIGETAGAAVSFQLYRAGMKKKAVEMADKHTFLKKVTASEGSRAGWLVFEARLLPFIPSGFVTLAAAISSIHPGTYLIATAVGKLPSIALEVLVSYDVIHLNRNWLRLVVTLMVAAIMAITLRGRK